jgi:hypothetical protein
MNDPIDTAGLGARKRVRGGAWLGAVVLLVFCAVASLPVRALLRVEPTCVAQVEDRGVHAPSVVAECRPEDGPVQALVPVRVVRVVSRCRSRVEGGLPPVRAPTS